MLKEKSNNIKVFDNNSKKDFKLPLITNTNIKKDIDTYTYNNEKVNII
jgi:hypothetical protein